MDIFDGRIVVSADDFEEVAYGIEQITAIFEEDINDVIGVLRCSRIEIESDAPPELNAQAETVLYNEFADIEYNDANGDGSYIEEARSDISERTGLDSSQIEIE